MAGIPPVAYIAQQVAGGHATVHILMKPGQNPHDYAPSPGEIVRLRQSDVFFITGMPFEKILGRDIASRVCDVTGNVAKVEAEGGHVCSGDHDHHAHIDEDALDPHVWLDPEHCKTMAHAMAERLAVLDGAHAQEYRKNAQVFAARMDAVKQYLSKLLAPYAQRQFYVHHSAYIYFANRFGLCQRAVELSGREISARHMAEIAGEMRGKKAGTILIQPELSPSLRQALTRATGAKVHVFDHLSPDVEEGMRSLGRVLAEDFARQDAEAKR